MPWARWQHAAGGRRSQHAAGGSTQHAAGGSTQHAAGGGAQHAFKDLDTGQRQAPSTHQPLLSWHCPSKECACSPCRRHQAPPPQRCVLRLSRHPCRQQWLAFSADSRPGLLKQVTQMAGGGNDFLKVLRTQLVFARGNKQCSTCPLTRMPELYTSLPGTAFTSRKHNGMLHSEESQASVLNSGRHEHPLDSAAPQLFSLWELVFEQFCYLWLEIDALPAPSGHPVYHYNCTMGRHVSVMGSNWQCKAACEDCLPLLLLIADLKLSSDSSCRQCEQS